MCGLAEVIFGEMRRRPVETIWGFLSARASWPGPARRCRRLGGSGPNPPSPLRCFLLKTTGMRLIPIASATARTPHLPNRMASLRHHNLPRAGSLSEEALLEPLTEKEDGFDVEVLDDGLVEHELHIRVVGL